MPRRVSVQGGVQAHAQGEFPGLGPGGDVCPGGVQVQAWGVCNPACTEADTPQQTATAAVGTHPTGMHSCFKMDSQIFQCNVHVDVSRECIVEYTQGSRIFKA